MSISSKIKGKKCLPIQKKKLTHTHQNLLTLPVTFVSHFSHCIFILPILCVLYSENKSDCKTYNHKFIHSTQFKYVILIEDNKMLLQPKEQISFS